MKHCRNASCPNPEKTDVKKWPKLRRNIWKKWKSTGHISGKKLTDTCHTHTAHVAYEALYESILPQTLRNSCEKLTQNKKIYRLDGQLVDIHCRLLHLLPNHSLLISSRFRPWFLSLLNFQINCAQEHWLQHFRIFASCLCWKRIIIWTRNLGISAVSRSEITYATKNGLFTSFSKGHLGHHGNKTYL